MLTKKLTKRCQSMPISAHPAGMNEKAHQAKALMGFDILVFAKPAPMASRGQCTPGFFKCCKALGSKADQKLAKDPAQRRECYGNLPEQSRAARAGAGTVQSPLPSSSRLRGRGAVSGFQTAAALAPASGGHRWDPAAVFLGGDRPVPAAPRLSSVGGAAIAPAGPFPAARRARGQRQAILNVGPGKTTED